MPFRKALSMLGITLHQYNGLKRSRPKFAESLPIYGEGCGRWFSIYDLWGEGQWVLLGDIARTLGAKQTTILSWIKVHDLLYAERRVLRHNRMCAPYHQVLALEVRLRVKGLVGRGKTTPWAEVDMWIGLGPEAIVSEAARQAVEELGELDFDELT